MALTKVPPNDLNLEVRKLAELADRETPLRGDCPARVLVVDMDSEYGQRLVTALRHLSIRAKHTQTVDEFLDLQCRERVDLVSLEIDLIDPYTLDNIKLLRTHFGEGPSTKIVVSSHVIPHAFAVFLEQQGADTCIRKRCVPTEMANALQVEIHKQKKLFKSDRAAEHGSKE